MKKTLVYTNDISDEEFKEMLRDYFTDEEVSAMSYDELYNRMSEYLDNEHHRVRADLNVQYNMLFWWLQIWDCGTVDTKVLR